MLIVILATVGTNWAQAETLEQFYERILERKATADDYDGAFAAIIRKQDGQTERKTAKETLALQGDESQEGLKVEMLELKILSKTETPVADGGAFLSVVSRARCRGTLGGQSEEATAVNHDILFRAPDGAFRMVALVCFMER